MGVTGMTVYHGQDVELVQGRRSWRVNNQEHTVRTGRSGWYCQEGGGLWFVGAPSPEAESDILYEEMDNFGRLLWRQGYVRSPGLRLIMEDRGSMDTEIDPENPGTLLRRGEASSALRGGDPYSVNWLMDENDDYDLTISPPLP
ncbi:hypothetical protein ACJZ2D_016957 [Fusarium nematophilum]